MRREAYPTSKNVQFPVPEAADGVYLTYIKIVLRETSVSTAESTFFTALILDVSDRLGRLICGLRLEDECDYGCRRMDGMRP